MKSLPQLSRNFANRSKIDAETSPFQPHQRTPLRSTRSIPSTKRNVRDGLPCLPSVEPTCPITPGSSRLRRYSIVPSNWLPPDPRNLQHPRVPSCNTVPSTVNSVPSRPCPAGPTLQRVGESVLPPPRLLVDRQAPRRRTLARSPHFTFSSRTASGVPQHRAAQQFVPTSATSPAYPDRIALARCRRPAQPSIPAAPLEPTYGRPRGLVRRNRPVLDPGASAGKSGVADHAIRQIISHFSRNLRPTFLGLP